MGCEYVVCLPRMCLTVTAGGLRAGGQEHLFLLSSVAIATRVSVQSLAKQCCGLVHGSEVQMGSY